MQGCAARSGGAALTELRVFADADRLGAALAGEILGANERAGGRPFLLGSPVGRSLRTTYRALGARGADLSRLVVVMMDCRLRAARLAARRAHVGGRDRREHAPRQPRHVPRLRLARRGAGVSVGLGTIAGARAVRLVLHGAGKRAATQRLLSLDAFDPAWPASIVHEHEDAEIWIDEEAAA